MNRRRVVVTGLVASPRQHGGESPACWPAARASAITRFDASAFRAASPAKSGLDRRNISAKEARTMDTFILGHRAAAEAVQDAGPATGRRWMRRPASSAA